MITDWIEENNGFRKNDLVIIELGINDIITY